MLCLVSTQGSAHTWCTSLNMHEISWILPFSCIRPISRFYGGNIMCRWCALTLWYYCHYTWNFDSLLAFKENIYGCPHVYIGHIYMLTTWRYLSTYSKLSIWSAWLKLVPFFFFFFFETTTAHWYVIHSSAEMNLLTDDLIQGSLWET